MKKILLFALVLALLLLPVGCTDSGKDKSADPTETTAESVVNTSEQPVSSDPSKETDPAVTTDTNDSDSNGGKQDSGGVELPIDRFGN